MAQDKQVVLSPSENLDERWLIRKIGIILVVVRTRDEIRVPDERVSADDWPPMSELKK